jgi:hypothetical protein
LILNNIGQRADAPGIPAKFVKKNNTTFSGITRSGKMAGKKEKIASVLQLVGGKRENVERIVEEIDKFFENLNAEIEDWKFSMEEYKDGTRIFARFQILVKK